MDETIDKLDRAIEYSTCVFGLELAFIIGLVYGQALV